MIFLGACCFALGWLLPGHYFPWPSFQQELTAAIAAAFFVFAAWRAQQELVDVPPLAILALTVSLVPVVQWSAGQIGFVSDAVLSALYLTGFAICVAAGATTVRSGQSIVVDAIAGAAIVAGIVSTALALCQWLGLSLGLYMADMPLGGRPYANLAQPNHLATLLALAVTSIWRLYELGRIRGAVAAAAAGYLGTGMALTSSRVALAYVLMATTWCLMLRRRAALRVRQRHILVLAGLYVLASLFWTQINHGLLLEPGRNLSSASSQGGATSMRLIHWATLWDAVTRAPWTGYGWGQVALAQRAAVLDHAYAGEVLSHSHNLLLDLLVWNGLPIGGLVILALTAWFLRQILNCKNANQASLLLGVGAVFIHALFEYPLSYAYFLAPTALLMGTLDGLSPSRLEITIPRWGFAGLAVIVLSVTAWVTVEYVEVEAQARTMRFVSAGIGTDKVNHADEPDVRLLDRQRLFHRYALSQAQPGMMPDAVEAAVRVSNMHPFAPSLLRQALILGLNNRPEEAEMALRRLCWTNPPESCAEGREAWSALQRQYPALTNIPRPPLPPVSTVSKRAPSSP